MSCNSSIAVFRVPFDKGYTAEQVRDALIDREETLKVEETDGKVDYMSVNEEKATFRPIKRNGRWYLDRIIEYNYEDCGDLSVELDDSDINEYLEELIEIDGISEECGWVFKAHVWYNGCEEPE